MKYYNVKEGLKDMEENSFRYLLLSQLTIIVD